MSSRVFCLRGLLIVATFALCFTDQLFAAEPAKPLHARIDALVEGAAIGPLPAAADDAEFVRRVYLDLNGITPTVDEAKAFLDDKSADKRTKLVDRLLNNPRYARWLSTVFDVLWSERRTSATVPAAEWQEYLYQAFAANRPYNELVREMITADIVGDKHAPASKFLFDREVEPNALTRDIGRLFFGMDMQCAQCHDHPIVDDYYQADYYGLYSFVSRTITFADKKAKNAKFIAEKADGETSFKSVFTGYAAEGFKPRLPKQPAIVEPVVAKGEEYVVKPEKDQRPVPTYSRRKKLAELVSAGDNPAFNRNIANRLWAHMFGRGIVHPVDFMHSDNPPSHPELLDLLAAEFRQSKYDIKALLRELALSRTYQRSCNVPTPDQVKFDQVAAKLKQLEVEQKASQAAADAAQAEVEKLTKDLENLKPPPKTPDAEIAKLDAAVKSAVAERDKLVAAAPMIKTELATKAALLQAVNAAVNANKAFTDLAPTDKTAAAAAQQILLRAKEIRVDYDAVRKKYVDSPNLIEAANANIAKAEQALAWAKNPPQTGGDREKIQLAILAAKNRVGELKNKAKFCDDRAKEAQGLVEYQKLAKTDKLAAERAWNSLVDSWIERGFVATLKPLSPEQFALSLMQASGQWSAQEIANVVAIDKKPPPEWNTADDKQKPAIKAMAVEKKTYDQFKPNVGAFVTLYGGQPGQDFAATLNQALFFGNGSLVGGWINVKPGSLSDRLNKQTDDRLLAEDLYLSVYNRRPADREVAEVAAFLKDRKDDRPAAIQEIVWALFSSNEFRFNH